MRGKTYAFRYRTGSDRFPVLVQTTWSHILAGPHPDYDYNPVPGTVAHRWVRGGGHHETPLYTDADGRIRYAKD